MKEPPVSIPLLGSQAHGRNAIVDADLPDLQSVLALRWYVNHKGYPYTFDWPHDRGRSLTVKLHHVVPGDLEAASVDHINRDPLDNRRANLRPASGSQNAMNREHPRGEVPYRGVSRRGTRFHAKLRWQGESLHLGNFETAVDAARVYDLFSLLIARDFARTNFDRQRYSRLVARLRVLIEVDGP